MSEEQPQPPPITPPQQDYSRPPEFAQGYASLPPGPPTALDRLIPAKNAKALLAYYMGVFSIVPCFTPILGPAAIVLGVLGLKECKRDPNLPGKGHAITGIVLGGIMTFLVLALVLFIFVFGKRTND